MNPASVSKKEAELLVAHYKVEVARWGPEEQHLIDAANQHLFYWSCILAEFV